MNTVRCNLCQADDWDVRFPSTLSENGAVEVSAFRCTSAGYGAHSQIVQCRQCGYVYANPRWEPDELLSAYATVEDDMYVQERAGRELTFRKHLAALEKYSGPGNGRTLLDVGAYIGVFVDVAQQAGWRALGVEPSRWAVEVAHANGANVIEGTLDAPQLQGETFDVVTMWDVIEHVDDPAGELAKAFALLKPGGVIAVHTMDIDSLTARLMGGRWPWLMTMHIHYFSRATLTQMMRQQGFDILWAGPQSRYLRMGYIATRVAGLSRFLGRAASAVIERFGWAEKAVPLNFGDLITVYGIRPNPTPTVPENEY